MLNIAPSPSGARWLQFLSTQFLYLKINDFHNKVFISHAKEDIQAAEDIYNFLEANGYSPWLDKKKLKIGSNWDYEIKKALKESTFVVILLSSTSVKKRGYIQREFKYAIEYNETKLVDDIYIIPILLDKCEVPEHLSKFQWIEVNSANFKESILDSLNSQRKKYLISDWTIIVDRMVIASVIITNGKLVTSQTYDFDIFLLSAGSLPFQLASHQYGITVDPTFINGGNISAECIPEMSTLSNIQQQPRNVNFDNKIGCINILSGVPPGPEKGSIIPCDLPGAHICKIRLINSKKFGVDLPNFKLTTSVGPGRVCTVIAAYIEGKNQAIGKTLTCM